MSTKVYHYSSRGKVPQSAPFIFTRKEFCFHKVYHSSYRGKCSVHIVHHSSSRGKGSVSTKCTTHLTEERVLCPQNVPFILPRKGFCVHKMYHSSCRGKSYMFTKCTTHLPEARVICSQSVPLIIPMQELCPQSVKLIFQRKKLYCHKV